MATTSIRGVCNHKHVNHKQGGTSPAPQCVIVCDTVRTEYYATHTHGHMHTHVHDRTHTYVYTYSHACTHGYAIKHIHDHVHITTGHQQTTIDQAT